MDIKYCKDCGAKVDLLINAGETLYIKRYKCTKCNLRVKVISDNDGEQVIFSYKSFGEPFEYEEKKLVKVKVNVETEFVGLTNDETDLNKLGLNLFNLNYSEIINQARDDNAVKIEAVIIENLNELPNGWNGNCCPFKCVFDGKDKKIKEYLS